MDGPALDPLPGGVGGGVVGSRRVQLAAAVGPSSVVVGSYSARIVWGSNIRARRAGIPGLLVLVREPARRAWRVLLGERRGGQEGRHPAPSSGFIAYEK